MKKKTNGIVGGQAVMEGVMMRFGTKAVTSVRKKSGIISRTDIVKKSKLSKIIFLRGIYNLFSMMILGTKTLLWSAQVHDDIEEEPVSKMEWFSIFAMSFLFVMVFFMVLPYFMTSLLFSGSGILFSFLEGLFRIGLFVGYVFVISRMSDIHRVFQYHGSEHKAVNCYESEGVISKVTVKKMLKVSRIHPRCGTSFIFIILIISIILFSFIPTNHFYIRIPLKLIFLPVVISISYEILLFSFKHPKNLFFRFCCCAF